MTHTRDSVLGEYYGVASDCVERNGAIAAMADEIARLRAENAQLGAVTIPLVADDTWALIDAVRDVCKWERPDDIAHLRAMLDAWDNHIPPERAP